MSDRDESGRFLPGNRFWEARSSHGRNPIFAAPDDLWSAVVEYFEWVGPVDDIPDELSRRELTFAFSNPLQDAIKRNKVMQFQTTIGLVGAAAQLDPTAAQDIDVRESLRDAVEGSGAPAKWLRKREDADDDAAAASQADGAMQLLQGAGAAGQAAEAIGKGGQAMKELSE